ncbi:RING finger and CHY zinc finger domain-containing protein 1-like, partial [Trifolium pratense]
MYILKLTGGHENFFHCNKCGCCYSTLLKNSHSCVEGAMHHDCPVCFEYLFESRNDVIVMPCGHTIHKSCLNEMREHYQYSCPLCSKSVCDMSKVWEKLDMEIAATPMPEPYQNKMVWILCNDCGQTSHVRQCHSMLSSLSYKDDVHLWEFQQLRHKGMMILHFDFVS